LGFVDQSRDDLDPNKNVWEEISGGADGEGVEGAAAVRANAR
jgi:hypothetical protein